MCLFFSKPVQQSIWRCLICKLIKSHGPTFLFFLQILSIIVVLCYLHLAVVTLISSKLVVMIMHIFSASCATYSVVISFLNSLKSLFLLNFLLQSSTAVQICFPRSVHFFISPLVNWKRNLHSPPCDRVCQQPQRV